MRGVLGRARRSARAANVLWCVLVQEWRARSDTPYQTWVHGGDGRFSNRGLSMDRSAEHRLGLLGTATSRGGARRSHREVHGHDGRFANRENSPQTARVRRGAFWFLKDTRVGSRGARGATRPTSLIPAIVFVEAT